MNPPRKRKTPPAAIQEAVRGALEAPQDSPGHASTRDPIVAELRAQEARAVVQAAPVTADSIPLAAQVEQTPEEKLRGDFRVFLWTVWMHLGLPAPTPVQYDLARYLQTGPRRCIVEAFRGVGKSWITVAFVLWLLYCDPDLKIMVVSASKVRADEFSTFALRLMQEMPMLAHMAPGKDQRGSKIAFDVGTARTSKDPSVKSVGITGQITGSRADVIIPDDVEVPGNSMTQGQRDKLAELVKEFDAVLKPGGRIIYLGTPQTEQSLYLTLTTRGYEARIWPVRYPAPAKIKGMYGAALAPFILRHLEADPSLVGKPVDPKRFNEADLLEREASYGRAGFALQFMLDTSLSDSDRYPLRLRDLMVMSLDPNRAPMALAWGRNPNNILSHLQQVGLNGDCWYAPMFTDPQWAAYTGCVMAVDPSGRGRDETAYAIVKILHGWLFLVAVGGFLGGYEDETLEAIAKAAKRHGVKHILVESNYGGGMFTKLLTPYLVKHHPVTVEDVHHQGQKERRIIDTLEPVMNQHRLVVAEEVVLDDERERYPDIAPDQQLRYRLFHQLTRITAEKGALGHDDRLEAVAMAVGYWVEQMARDGAQAAEDSKNAALEAELDNFLEHALGTGSVSAPNWNKSCLG